MVSFRSTFSPIRAMAAKKTNPAAAPISESGQVSRGFHRGESNPATSSGQVISCGKSQVSRSM